MHRMILFLPLAALVFMYSTVAFPGDKQKKEPGKITVAAEKTPFEKTVKFSDGDSYIVVLPNQKEVALWAEKDRLPIAEFKTKSGLQCWWGGKTLPTEAHEGFIYPAGLCHHVKSGKDVGA